MSSTAHKSKTISGLKWSGLNQVIKQGLNITIGIILARLLNPSDFGLLGMVTVFTGFIQLFNDFGFGAALIQKQDADDLDFNSVFWFNLITGIVFFVLLTISASFIANFYNKPQISLLVKLVAWVFIIQALGYVQFTRYRKELNFKSLFIIESLSMLFSGLVALIMAYRGFGVYSLISQVLVSSVVTLFCLWIFSTWKPRFQFSKLRIQSLLKFSMPLMGSTAMGYALGNVDKILIGRFLGAPSLGIYTRAYSLMVFPVGQISGVISQVMFPSFAQIQDDKERIKGIYLKLNNVISAITFPIMAGAFVFAEPFILLVLGEQWREMIPIFKILTFIGALQSVGTLVGNIFMALGEMKLYFKVNLFSGLIFVVASIIGVNFGLLGVTISLLLATLIVAIPQWLITGNLVALSIKKYLKAMQISTLIVVFLVALFSFVNWQFKISINWFNFLCSLFLFTATYMFMSYLLNQKLMENIGIKFQSKKWLI